MKIRLVSILSVIIFFILVTTATSTVQVMKIDNGSEPAVDVNKAVWTYGGTIHIYDLSTKKETITNFSEASHPAISGSKLVWLDESAGVPRLTVYDIRTGSMSYISKDVDSESIPAIYGNRIVWSANSGIYLRDISSSTQARIANGTNPDIYGNRVVYSSDSAGDTPQIYLYDVSTKKSIDVSEYGDNFSPRIYGDKIIWSDFYTRLGNIRMYDIVTGQQIEVTTGDDKTGYDTGGAIDISSNKIVYLKHSDLADVDSGDVYIYDIATGKSMQLSSGGTAQTPIVSSNTVVWSDSGSIYLTSL